MNLKETGIHYNTKTTLKVFTINRCMLGRRRRRWRRRNFKEE
jgi:hypothetical protein